jgi:CHAT domain-containing protein
VLKRDLSRFRYIHFATHGLLNSAQPELSGLVFSLVDETGQPQDGFLRLHEVFNLKLNAEVVVLSACQTALGKEVRGEGLIGLTRGFMYAGAPRVLASLWPVDDLATAELMKRFYRGLLKDNARPAAALRAAQLEIAKQKRWAAPFYWAGFVMQGEWR